MSGTRLQGPSTLVPEHLPLQSVRVFIRSDACSRLGMHKNDSSLQLEVVSSASGSVRRFQTFPSQSSLIMQNNTRGNLSRTFT